MPRPEIGLGRNSYGKDGIRLVLVRRPEGEDGPHELRDLTVDVRLTGDFERVHTAGDNETVLPTDTMRSTVYALAQEHLTGAIEDFGWALCQRFLVAAPAARTAEVRLAEHGWARASVGGAEHPHAFVATSGEVQTAVVRAGREQPPDVTSGLRDLVLLRTRGSAFDGFLRDVYTVLPETRDRIMATAVTAEWTSNAGNAADGGVPTHDPVRAGVRTALLETFATHPSESVQHTLYAMGEAALETCSAVDSIRLVLPNKHHVPVDLAALGIPNDRAVYVATDRPFGVIEATVRRASPTPEQDRGPATSP